MSNFDFGKHFAPKSTTLQEDALKMPFLLNFLLRYFFNIFADKYLEKFSVETI
jgi:hypothetical protein